MLVWTVELSMLAPSGSFMVLYDKDKVIEAHLPSVEEITPCMRHVAACCLLYVECDKLLQVALCYL